ncbi:DNA supercoiling [Wallemia mellicola]|uniref:DNA supercoiling n=1 Tax=Wallemia mellicola TaxID=1708541 RepID=A0A4T0MDA1_9BASI|nr:DNA supercoiling [Wallemia mellicola]TIC34162.1 DNA supercoiling [Wallemia mellicola]
MYRAKTAEPSSSTSSSGSTSALAPPSSILAKPFKVPTLSSDKLRAAAPTRLAKKRVSYKEEESKENRKRGKVDDDYHEDSGVNRELGFDLKTLYPVYEVKPASSVLGQGFKIPPMKDKATGRQVIVPLSGMALGTRIQPPIPPRPLHDPMAEHAIVLYDPTIDDIEEKKEEPAIPKPPVDRRNRSVKDILGIKSREELEKDVKKVPVVIDPILSKVLRPHQVEGVKFLYRCTTGLTAPDAQGCIMADEMGLGGYSDLIDSISSQNVQLQCIALLWTLLKQSPIPGKPTVEKCIIVCPSSLVPNWANEFTKWLGTGAVGCMAVDHKGTKEQLISDVKQWCAASGRSVTQPVMIVSYETLRNLTEVIGRAQVGLMMLDEGHRMKNSESMTFKALTEIHCKRRVILSGTPIQNDLSEYFSLLNFANPDYLGNKNEFRKNFENIILRGRDALATDKEKQMSEEKLKELNMAVSKFIIRRTNDILSKFLPVKYEHVVFTALSPLQLDLYKFFIESPETQALLKGKASQPLKAIGILKKLCNHPNLISPKDDIPGSKVLLPGENIAERLDKKRPANPAWSGKMMVLMRFIERMRKNSDDKIVLVSNYTQTLDLLEKLFAALRWGFMRLDGTMAVKKRGKLVDRFNDPESREFIFLLSSKAGGCGLNLIGANRLILFDPDWNPAADQQALARVWRDGQKKECFVYRFIGTGTLEEQVLMRQAYKQSLSACVVDEAEDADRHFSKDLLRELFKHYPGTDSHMHDTFKCKRCDKATGKQIVKAPALLYGDVSTWNHYSNACLKDIHDDLLRAETGMPDVTKVFQLASKTPVVERPTKEIY